MRKHLMLSTAAIGLMLASGVAYAQAPERKDEQKRTEEPAKSAAPQRGGAGQERAQERAQERVQGGQEKLQGAAREEKGGAAKHEASEDKRQPATAAEHNAPNAREQAQESREPSKDRNREAESAKSGHDADKNRAETKSDKSAPQKSTAETEKSKSGPAAQQNERTGAAANQGERNQTQPPRNAAEQSPAQQGNRPASATETSRTPPTNNAQSAPAATGTQTNQANQTSQTNTQVSQQTRVNSEKQVQISERLSRERLAEPERNLNISIRAGETIPPHVHLYRLPPEIVSIEPEYRDYEYFATDDDVVIVDPRTHRIVSQVPRDPSRARAEMSGSASTSMAATGGSNASSSVNCRIMRRDASGNVAEVEPSTVGSSARTDSLSVTVQMPGGGSSAPIPLGAAAGDIVVATQGQGDCTVTIEPQTR
ncbi:DUF1236 domain-containing protein [Bradyrhizobium sp. DASA03076]|uniref:DUF1236 domain-containing protein n=1 Tax=Bradyrhizobium sp. BLXBL-03 TaxID=3395916 RepID=UPI003F6F2236